MRAMSEAIEGVAAFSDMMKKIAHADERVYAAKAAQDQEIAAWNAEVDRKRAEKKARKAQHTKALDGLR